MTNDTCAGISLGDRLLWARKKAGLTQVQLSKKAGISQAAISDFEVGRTASGYGPTLFALAAALEVNVNWLQSGVGQPYQLGDADRESLHSMVDQLTPEQITIAKGLMRVITSGGASS